MNKFLLIFILFFLFIEDGLSQSKNVSPRVHTERKTTHIQLNEWENRVNPFASDVNKNWEIIDKQLYELVLETNPYYFEIINNFLKFSNLLSGHNCFNSTNTIDTVNVPGMKKNDVVVVTIWDSVPIIQDAIGVQVENDYFICKRNSGGTNSLYYTWLWVKKE
jgi:hypothetical protein